MEATDEQLSRHLETFFILQFLVSNETIGQILYQRQQKETNQKEFLEDIEYSVLSSIFVDRFYGVSHPKRLREESEDFDDQKSTNQTISESKHCRYREITHPRLEE